LGQPEFRGKKQGKVRWERAEEVSYKETLRQQGGMVNPKRARLKKREDRAGKQSVKIQE